MKNIRKTITFMAILAGTITLSACGNVNIIESSNSSSKAETTISSETAATPASAEKTETNDENIVSTEETITTEISENEPDTEGATVSDNKNNTFTSENIISDEQVTTTKIPENEPVTMTETVSDNQNNNSTIADNSQEYMDKAYELIDALNCIDKIGSANITFDESAVYTDENGNTFAKVTGTQFSDTSALREYMESYLTDMFLNDRYSGILGTDDPAYIDVDGVLYGKMNAKGGGFPWTNTPLKIENATDSTFRILAEYDNYGAPETMSIEVVMDNGRWKIDWVTFGL